MLDAEASAWQRLGAARKAAAEAMVSRASIVPDRGADIGAFLQQRDDLRARYNPTFAVIRDYKAEVAGIREAHRTGVIGVDEMTAALSRERRAALASIDAIKGRKAAQAAGGGLEPWQQQNLRYQVIDTVQSLALGMPAHMVLMQQGPQVLQIYGSIGAAAKAAAAAVTPLRLAIGGTTAALAIGATAWQGYLTSIKEVETAASGLGRSVAGSPAEMERAAQAGAAAAGISVKAARSMEAQFLRTGRIGSENFEGLIGLSKDFAATIGVSADEAGGALAEMFADPARAADTLWRRMGLIDGATAELATSLARQNRISEAQAVLIDALPDRLAKASEATTALGRAWNWVAIQAGDAMDAIGGAIDKVADGVVNGERPLAVEQNLDSAIKTAQSRLDALRKGDVGMFDRVRQMSGLGQSEEGNLQADLNTLYAMRNRRLEADARRSERELSIRQGADAYSTAESSPANQSAIRRRDLAAELERLRRGAIAEGLGAEHRAFIERADAATQRAIETYIPEAEKALRIAELDLRIQTERNGQMRATLAGERERVSLAGEVIEPKTAEARIENARRTSLQQSIAVERQAAEERLRSRDEMIAGQELEISLIGRTAGEVEQLQARHQMLADARAAAFAEGRSVDAAELAAIEEKAAALGRLADQAARVNLRSNLQFERDQLFRSPVDQRIASELRGANLPVDLQSTEAQEIRINEILKERVKIWEDTRDVGRDAVDSLVDSASKGFSDIGDVAEDIGKEVQKTFLDLAIKNPLKNAIYGDSAPTLDSVGGIGGLFGALLGKPNPALQAGAQSVGAMTVSAGTVVVNGGIGGGLPGTGTPGSAGLPALTGANDNAGGLPIAGKTRGGIDLATVKTAEGLTAQVNAKYAANFQGVIDDLEATGYRIKSLGGYNYRNIAGTNRLSNHAYGNAIDINPAENPMGSRLVTDMPSTASMIARQNGTSWGGDWRSKKDAMHFEINEGSAMGAVQRMAKGADQAAANLTQVSQSSSLATQGLGTLGSGMNSFGQQLGNLQFPAAPSGGGGGLFDGLLKLILPDFVPHGAQASLAASGNYIGMFADGGGPLSAKSAKGKISGPGGPREDAILLSASAGEYIVNADATARNLPLLEAINAGRPVTYIGGRANGGHIETRPAPAMQAMAGAPSQAAAGGAARGWQPMTLAVHDYVGGVDVQGRQRQDQNGNPQIELQLSRAVARGMSAAGGEADELLDQRGARKPVIRRW
ncbi:phage tail length tape measure family protein [Ensifer soli]|uniref:phage tail length tape measure family protein n=1 Tax=Ciceribacter sp. sgz301302 TaxID=3342379 RepID=UPI0035BB129F